MNNIHEPLKTAAHDLQKYWYFIPLLYIGEAVFLYGVLQQVTGDISMVQALATSLCGSAGFLLAFLFIVGDPRFDRSVKTNTIMFLRLAVYSLAISTIIIGIEYGIGSRSLMASPSLSSITFTVDLVYPAFAQPALWTLWILLFITFPGYFRIAQDISLRDSIRESLQLSFWQPKQTSIALIGSFILVTGITALFSVLSLVTGFRTTTISGYIVPLALSIVLLGPAVGGVIGLRFARHYLASTSEAETI